MSLNQKKVSHSSPPPFAALLLLVTMTTEVQELKQKAEMKTRSQMTSEAVAVVADKMQWKRTAGAQVRLRKHPVWVDATVRRTCRPHQTS